MAPPVTIHATVTVLAPPNRREQVVQGLRSLAGRTRLKPGCVGCDLLESVESAGTFAYVEVWAKWLDFERHLRSEEYRRLLIVIELAAEPPDIQYRLISTVMGLEAVHAIRGE